MKRVLPLLIPFMLSASTSLPQHVLSDRVYADTLVGTWGTHFSYDDGAEVFYTEKTYRRDGTAEGSVSHKVRLPSGKYRIADRISYKSRWHIANGVVVITRMHFSPPEPGLEAVVMRDRIVVIDGEKAVFENVEDGTRFEAYRQIEATSSANPGNIN